MQHYHSSIRWKHIWQVHRHQELKIVLFFFSNNSRLCFCYGLMALGHPLGLNYWEGRKRWQAAMVMAQEEEAREREILRASA